MRKLPFKKSSVASIGVELEFQLIDPHSYGLISRAKDLIRNIEASPYQSSVSPVFEKPAGTSKSPAGTKTGDKYASGGPGRPGPP